jgi:hypothetical protein
VAGYPGIDDAWPTRLPPGWKIFPDGSPGPANTPSPIDSAWPSRVPQYGGYPSNPQPTLPAVGPAQGTSLSTTGGDSLSVRPGSLNPYGAGMPRGTGPDIMSPSSQPLRSGVSPAVRTGPGPFTDATFSGTALDESPWWRDPKWAASEDAASEGPVAANGASAPNGPNWWGAAAKALPYASRVLGPLGVYFGSTTPTANDSAPTNMWNQRPSGLGPMPAASTPDVTNRPQDRPSYAGPTVAAPAVPPPRPRVRPKPAVVAQKPNLGLYDTTITRPNIDVLQGGRNNPHQQTQMGVLDFSKLFQRPQ